MTNLVISHIRTYVPILVGYLLAQLTMLGITIAPEHESSLTGALTAILAGGYYAFARWAENKFSWAHYLLGYDSNPLYFNGDDLK